MRPGPRKSVGRNDSAEPADSSRLDRSAAALQPKPQEATYFVDRRQVAGADFERMLHSMKEVRHTWFCAETNDGGITGYDAVDGAGVCWEYRAKSDANGATNTLVRKPAAPGRGCKPE